MLRTILVLLVQLVPRVHPLALAPRPICRSHATHAAAPGLRGSQTLLAMRAPEPKTLKKDAANAWTKADVNGEADDAPGGVAAASALVSSAIIAEGIQILGTAVLLFWGQQFTQTGSPVDAVQALITYIHDLGLAGYGVFAALMVFLQVVPIAAAFVLTVSAGAIFGAVKGTAVVLTCSTLSASISFLISRSVGRDLVLESARDSPQFQAIDNAFGRASFGTSLTLITLLRLSPVLPFAWANYTFGLSPVPWGAFTLGTFVGSLPAVAGYVSAGELGAEIAVNGADTNPLVLGLGIAATLGAITVAGNIANDALKDMDINL